MGRLLRGDITVSTRMALVIDATQFSSRILGLVSVHAPTMPLHIACLYHLSHLHSKLFILAHELVEKEPENPISWYAVGVWYLTVKKWSEARTYFRQVHVMRRVSSFGLYRYLTVRHPSWTHDLPLHGWLSRIHSHLRASTTTPSLHTPLVLECSQGEVPYLLLITVVD